MSGPVAKEFEAANDKYAAQFTKGDLPLPPGRKVLAIVCMDARIDPARALGLEEGDARRLREMASLMNAVVHGSMRVVVPAQAVALDLDAGVAVLHQSQCCMSTVQ